MMHYTFDVLDFTAVRSRSIREDIRKTLYMQLKFLSRF